MNHYKKTFIIIIPLKYRLNWKIKTCLTLTKTMLINNLLGRIGLKKILRKEILIK